MYDFKLKFEYLPLMKFLLLLLLPFFTLTLQAKEPTNAKEAAEQKAARDKVTAEKFAVWKAKLPAEQQAWETVLEQNLGTGFIFRCIRRTNWRAESRPGIMCRMIPSCHACF